VVVGSFDSEIGTGMLVDCFDSETEVGLIVDSLYYN
jgi:hypothetical protein